MPPKKNPLEIVPIPQKKSLLPIPPEKTPFKRGRIILSSPPHPKKKPLKNKIKLNPLSLFLKSPLPTCNSLNLIELFTPYTN